MKKHYIVEELNDGNYKISQYLIGKYETENIVEHHKIKDYIFSLENIGYEDYSKEYPYEVKRKIIYKETEKEVKSGDVVIVKEGFIKGCEVTVISINRYIEGIQSGTVNIQYEHNGKTEIGEFFASFINAKWTM